MINSSVARCVPARYPCPGEWWTLKQANGGQGVTTDFNAGQNYPNPLEAATGFKTTIPFATQAAGNATIKIVNENGQNVLTDDMDVLGSGQHFFYFTGDKLPAGKYFYTIEFPKGVVIATKSMLIVK